MIYSPSDLLPPLPPPSVVPPCPVFGTCGGCQLQDRPYDVELAWKEAVVKAALQPFIAEAECFPIVPMDDPWGYRARIQVHQNTSGHLGFYEEGTHALAPITACAIAHPRLNEALAELSREKPKAPRRLSLVWNPASDQVYQYADEAETVFFTQVNPLQNRLLQERVIDWIAPTRETTILELYAGSGNLTLPLAEKGARITAVEASPYAVKEGMRRSGKQAITWMAMGARHALKVLGNSQATRGRFTTCLVDPPRSGLKDAASLLLSFQFEKMVYVACSHEALAADLRTLTQPGAYRVTRVLPIDFFPKTTHVEVMVELLHTSRVSLRPKARSIRF